MVQRARASAHPSAPKGPGGSLHTATCSPVQQRRPWLACQQTGGSHCALLACRPDGVRERVRRGSCRVWAALRISISGCGSPQMERAMEAAVPSDRRAPGPQLQARHAAARAAARSARTGTTCAAAPSRRPSACSPAVRALSAAPGSHPRLPQHCAGARTQGCGILQGTCCGRRPGRSGISKFAVLCMGNGVCSPQPVLGRPHQIISSTHSR